MSNNTSVVGHGCCERSASRNEHLYRTGNNIDLHRLVAYILAVGKGWDFPGIQVNRFGSQDFDGGMSHVTAGVDLGEHLQKRRAAKRMHDEQVEFTILDARLWSDEHSATE